MTGLLVLVATPIGHLGDLSPRAAQTLRDADVIACEDTRRLAKLLNHAGIPRPPVLVVNDHTEATRIPEVLALLAEGRTVAVTTDAGMPGISDPGERLVRAAVAAGHPVSAVPGPSAALTALVVSGLPTGRFVVEGFLPRSGSTRTTRLAALAGERRTIVLFEAPHRLTRTLDDLAGVLGDRRRVAVARELTKVHEQVWRGTLAEAVTTWSAGEVRGEVVLVLEGAPEEAPADEATATAALRALLDGGADRRKAVAEVAATFGLPRRQVYDLALRLKADRRTAGDDPGNTPARGRTAR